MQERYVGGETLDAEIIRQINKTRLERVGADVKQFGDSECQPYLPYTTPDGRTVELLAEGIHDATVSDDDDPQLLITLKEDATILAPLDASEENPFVDLGVDPHEAEIVHEGGKRHKRFKLPKGTKLALGIGALTVTTATAAAGTLHTIRLKGKKKA